MMKQHKWMIFLVFAFFLGIVMATLGSPSGSFAAGYKIQPDTVARGCTVHELIQVPPGYPKVPRIPPFLGVLKGSWYEIGKQYGEKAGYLARYVFDKSNFYKLMLKRHGYKNLVEDLYRYEKSIREWNPDYIDLMKGAGDGASAELNRSENAKDLTSYEKILFLNVYSPFAFRHPVGYPDKKARENFPVQIPKESAYWKNAALRSIGPAPQIQLAKLEAKLEFEEEDCTSIVALPKATTNGKIMLAGNTQSGFGIGNYTLAYVIEPPDGNRFWTSTIPGFFMNLKGANEKGVSFRHQAGGKADCAYGVPWVFLFIEMMRRANNTDEAIEILTRGTPEYRQRAGRKSLLREGGILLTLADEQSAAVVELTARYYATRRPGDLGEKDFIVCANHYYIDHSYDENNVRTNVSMMDRAGDPDPGFPDSSHVRYWAAYWLGMNARGTIDEEWLQNVFLGYHVAWDKDGKRYTQKWSDKHKIYVPSKFSYRPICNHPGGWPEKYANNIPCPFMSVPVERTVYWIVYKPEFWVGPWECYTFSPTGD